MNRNPASLLARLFGRANPQPLVTSLFANAIGQPLLVHPAMGEQIIGAYLHGAIDARPATQDVRVLQPESTDPATGVVTSARTATVINVSGGLVNRFEGGACDPGPLSYQEIRAVFDRALAAPSCEAIVLRLESPGGMAAGVFDLAEHIHASRGQKRIIACIDDYAYSAAYAIAAACDEIRVTRTGGAGSVGVIAYHVDQSRWEQNIGIAVSTIYSGAHKADMSPHAPLSDTTRAWLQDRMDSMRDMFASAVAKFRGMELEAVLATEAQVYQGEQAVAIGFADRIGTFAELMSELAAGWAEDADAMAQEREADVDNEEMQAASAAHDALADLASTLANVTAGHEADGADAIAQFAAAVANSNLPPAAAVGLIARGPASGQSTGDAVAYARDVHDACFAAGLDSVAGDYIKQNIDLSSVRAQLIAAKAASGPEIVTAIPSNASQGDRLDHTGIYERRAKRQ